MFIIFQTSPSPHEYNHMRDSHGSEDFKQNSVRLVENQDRDNNRRIFRHRIQLETMQGGDYLQLSRYFLTTKTKA